MTKASCRGNWELELGGVCVDVTGYNHGVSLEGSLPREPSYLGCIHIVKLIGLVGEDVGVYIYMQFWYLQLNAGLTGCKGSIVFGAGW